jgi:hypothetical protein
MENNIFCFSDEKLEIYFNTKKKCYLAHVEGTFHSYSDEAIYLPNDNESIITAQQKLLSLKHLGKEYEEVYITYIPAKEFQYYPAISSNIEKFPKPLIKVSEEFVNDSVAALFSGRRSAIQIDDGKAIRLKGCGNELIGFNLAEVADIGPEHKEIRGAQFKTSCLREQYLTNFVNKILIANNMLPGNVPIGFYIYSDKFNITHSFLKNEAPLVDKYCGLFYTNGEKRLGHDLFKAIDIILHELLRDDDYLNLLFGDFVKFDEVAKSLPNKNFKAEEDFMEILFNEKIYENDNFSNESLFNLNQYLSNKSCTLLISKEEEILEKLAKNIPELLNLFTNLKNSNQSFFNLVIILLSKISYEVGLTKKLFEDNEFNWGTYDYHCNAHLDNFILLPPNDKGVLLAPVDFDLAFTRDQFIDIKYKNSEGIENQVTFDNLIMRERNCLLMQLIGINMIPNIEVSVLYLDKLIEDNKPFSKNLENLHNLLKENNAYNFYAGFNMQENNFQNYYKILRDLVEILLKIQ